MNAQDNGSQSLHDGRADGFPAAVKAESNGMADKRIWPMPDGIEAAARQARGPRNASGAPSASPARKANA